MVVSTLASGTPSAARPALLARADIPFLLRRQFRIPDAGVLAVEFLLLDP